MEESTAPSQTQTIEHNGTIWIDAQDPDQKTLEKLEGDYQLHPIYLKESLRKIQHAKVDRGDDYLFMVLRVPVWRSRHGKIDVRQIGVFLGKNYLVTVHSGENPLISKMINELRNSAELLAGTFHRGAGYVLYELINQLLQLTSDMIENILDELDDIEDAVFDTSRSDAEPISRMRQRIIKLRSIVGPKRLVLQDLSEQIGEFAGHNLTRYYSSNTKTANRLWEVIEEAKDTIEIYKDADFTTNTEQTNKTLAVLTLIFTFTIPMTVLGTVYGMNIRLPGSVNGKPWGFLGSFTTLWLALGVSALAALFMYLYFKKKRWL